MVRLSRMAARAGLTIVMALAIVLAGAHVPGRVMAAGTAPDLGVAGDFAVLAYSTVTNTGSTVIAEGDVGVYPLTSITGFPPGVLLNGTIRIADGVAQTGQADLAVAYANLAGQAADYTYAVPTDLGGMTLPPGVYRFGSSAAVTGTLTLDAGSDPNPVWIFQIGSTLTVASGATVALQGAASACNSVFWQVGTSATLVTGATFVGDILAMESITVQSGASTTGRLLARTGAVTLDGNTMTPCGAPLEGSLVVLKFDDTNGNTFYDPLVDIPLPGWQFAVDDSGANPVSGSPFTTNELGLVVLTGLAEDTYTVTETLQSGWQTTTPGGITQTGTVVDGEVTTLQFGNELEDGVVGIFKFNDLNGDASWDSGEPPLENWVFGVVGGTGGTVGGSPFTTDASGFIVLTGLSPDTYTVTETVQTDWELTAPNDQQVTVGGAAPGGGMLYFGNMQAGQGVLTIFKFNDLDGNGVYDPGDGETPLSNWEFRVDDGDTYSEYYDTDATGLLIVTGLMPGDYTVTETAKLGWTLTTDNDQVTTVSNTSDARLSFGNRYTYVPPPPPAVGGEASPVNKVAVVLPWIVGLAVVAGGSVILRRRVRSER